MMEEAVAAAQLERERTCAPDGGRPAASGKDEDDHTPEDADADDDEGEEEEPNEHDVETEGPGAPTAEDIE